MKSFSIVASLIDPFKKNDDILVRNANTDYDKFKY